MTDTAAAGAISGAEQNRWQDAVMSRDSSTGDTADTDELLRSGSSDLDRTLFILSEGFDPRCTVALQRFIDAHHGRCPFVLALDPERAGRATESSTSARKHANAKKLEELAGDRLKYLGFPDVADDNSAGRRFAQHITAEENLRPWTTIIVDSSAFPTNLAFPIIDALLQVCRGSVPELQVVVTEDPALDSLITESSFGEPNWVPGFPLGDIDSSPNLVWTPVLGMGGGAALVKIANVISPREVCPILPFPAVDPRQPDRIFNNHRQFFEERAVDPNDIIYAAEWDPFDLYRTLVQFARDYRQTLDPIGGAKVVVSAHGSKLLSMGALLAAHEADLPVISVRAHGYRLDEQNYAAATVGYPARITCLWLAGSPYSSI